MTTSDSEKTNSQKFLSVEFLGEVVLLAVVGAVFAYMLWDSQEWGTGAWLLPRITIAFGIPFWVWRIVFKKESCTSGILKSRSRKVWFRQIFTG